MTARLLKVGFLLACAMAAAPVQAAEMCRPPQMKCSCDCPAPPRGHARMMRPGGQAYAESFYDYRSASYVDNRNWHGEWVVAPNDGYVEGPRHAPRRLSGYYAPPAAYYPPPEDFGPPPVNYGPTSEIYGSIDDRGLNGGVGYGGVGYGGADGGGGGGGGYGQVFFADGGLGMNGYGNGQVNPSAAPVQGYAGKALYAVQNPPSASK